MYCWQTVEVNRLIKARPLDNMEFMQWFKAYWDSHNGDRIDTYDAIGRRAASKTGEMRKSKEAFLGLSIGTFFASKRLLLSGHR